MASDEQTTKQPRWHLLYYVLAVFDILTVSFSLTLSHTLMDIYTNSVESNQQWAARIGKIDELRERAVHVNAPGNDVFDTQNVAQESARLQAQLVLYWQETQAIRDEIIAQIEAARAQPLLDQLNLSSLAMKTMLAESDLIFSYFTHNEPEKAGKRMATMDRQFAQLNFALGKLSADIRDIQKVNFSAQILRANNLKKYEYVIAALILLMVGAVTIYGHKISQEMRRYNVERETYVTQLTEQDIQLQRAVEKLQCVDKAKTEFLSNMSHELRTPMNGVLGMLTLLLDEDMTKAQINMATIAKDASENLLYLLNELLDFAKIEAGKVTLEHVPFNPVLVLEEVVNTFAAKVREKNLALILNIPPNTLPDHILGDSLRLQQVLNNLLSNAIKFTAQGHVLLEADVTEHAGETILHITVEDTGIGIPEAKRSDIFNKFAQAEASTAREYGGTGLGLAICAQLVSLMHGSISVHSGARGGSRFCLDLPLRDSDCTVTPMLLSLEGCRILLVDDDPLVTGMLSQTLHATGAVTSQQNLPQKVVTQLLDAINQQQPYEVVIIDDIMPTVSGFELLKNLKAEPALAALRSILLCTEYSSEEIRLWENVGIEGYVSKPVKPSALTHVVENAMQKAPSATLAPLVKHFKTKFDGSVLVVDDNHVNRIVALSLLEKFGLQVDLTASGVEALTKLTEHSYNLVFMDCQMSELNGYETTQKIRQRQWHVPVVAMTANALPGEEQKCLDAGMNGYLAKPIDVAILESILHEWVPVAGAPPSASTATDSTESEHASNSTQDFPDRHAITQKLAELNQMLGEDAVRESLLSVLVVELPQQMDHLRSQYAATDNDAALRASAHLLKGTISVINGVETCQWCKRLEQAESLEARTLAFESIERAIPSILALLNKAIGV